MAGPPLARAAAAGLVRIEGGHGSNLAAVSKSGRLSVNPGLKTTAAGQVTATVAGPADAVVASGAQNCSARGIYTVPARKALIITGVTFYMVAFTSGGRHGLNLAAGPAATPCKAAVASAEAIDSAESQYQGFTPGIPVPAGDAVGLNGFNEQGLVVFYGYLVPAAAVPANVLKNLPATAPAGPRTATPRR